MIEHADLVVSALLARDGQLLVVANDWQPGQALWWTLPGGAVEPGESLVEAAAREVREESGLEVTAWRGLAYVAQIHWSEPPTHFVMFCFAAADWRGQVQPADPDGDCRQAEFLPEAQALERLRVAVYRPIAEWLASDRTHTAFYVITARNIEDKGTVEWVG